AGELIELGQGSTGAANDLAQATELATHMVREFGLSPLLGPIGYPEGGSVFLGGGGGPLSSRPFGESTQAAIDSEVGRLVHEAEETAMSLLRTHRDQLRALVDLLMYHETVEGEVVYRLLGAASLAEAEGGVAVAPHRTEGADAGGRDATNPGPPAGRPGTFGPSATDTGSASMVANGEVPERPRTRPPG
ncbi:MAG TPA: hypothetical protein VE152_08250, partial [Acidimicrobiales bacterium]|nr:hypothetical protein [Acidimicrobiales bacterium]